MCDGQAEACGSLAQDWRGGREERAARGIEMGMSNTQWAKKVFNLLIYILEHHKSDKYTSPTDGIRIFTEPASTRHFERFSGFPSMVFFVADNMVLTVCSQYQIQPLMID